MNDLLAQAQAIVGQGAPKPAAPATNDGMLSAANAILNGTGAAPVAAPAEAPKAGIANSVTNMLSNLME